MKQRRLLVLVALASALLTSALGVGPREPAPQASVPKRPAVAGDGLDYASDGVPGMPSDPSALPSDDGLRHPHPITPAHERIYRENNLVGALNLAVDLEDPLRIRELVAQYRAEYPEDEHRLQDGYAIIADCLDRPDTETRARAHDFWSHQIRSQTRRYVRRHCLER